jgi:hypothetical protein
VVKEMPISKGLNNLVMNLVSLPVYVNFAHFVFCVRNLFSVDLFFRVCDGCAIVAVVAQDMVYDVFLFLFVAWVCKISFISVLYVSDCAELVFHGMTGFLRDNDVRSRRLSVDIKAGSVVFSDRDIQKVYLTVFLFFDSEFHSGGGVTETTENFVDVGQIAL